MNSKYDTANGPWLLEIARYLNQTFPILQSDRGLKVAVNKCLGNFPNTNTFVLNLSFLFDKDIDTLSVGSLENDISKFNIIRDISEKEAISLYDIVFPSFPDYDKSDAEIFAPQAMSFDRDKSPIKNLGFGYISESTEGAISFEKMKYILEGYSQIRNRFVEERLVSFQVVTSL